jgi:hypothetical protein
LSVRHCATPQPQSAPSAPHARGAHAGRPRATGADYLSSPVKYLAITAQVQVVVTLKRTALMIARLSPPAPVSPPAGRVPDPTPRREVATGGLRSLPPASMRMRDGPSWGGSRSAAGPIARQGRENFKNCQAGALQLKRVDSVSSSRGSARPTWCPLPAAPSHAAMRGNGARRYVPENCNSPSKSVDYETVKNRSANPRAARNLPKTPPKWARNRRERGRPVEA